MNTRRVAVIGAGVVGLAPASALVDAGAEVRLYDRQEPGREQSKGSTRVFRLAHGDARLVDLAARAERLWRAWEQRFRRRLVGDEGLILTGDDTVAGWAKAMADAGARYAVIDIKEANERIPVARLAGSAALLDPAAGPTRARRTVECLLAVCGGALCRDEVLEVTYDSNGCSVATAAGIWRCDEVIIAAGVDTGRLAAAAGAGVETPTVPDSRLTYAIRAEYRERPLACWFDQSGAYGPGYDSYGQRVGSTGYYAVGVGWGDAAGLSADEESALHREKSFAYMREAYPGLDPTPVDEIRCISTLRGVRDDGDGFFARRSGGITALHGKNLFKFAPLLGELLAQTALTGVLADELTLDKM
jgi:sarcosine oxidase